MSKHPSDTPPQKPGEEADEKVTLSVSKPDRSRTEFYPFGLSGDQFARVTREMLAVARLVCRHSGASPGDAVQQAFVTALSKPTVERPSIQNEKKFVGYMCTLAKYEALTNRTYQRRRSFREIISGVDIADIVGVPPSVDAVEARKMVHSAFLALKPKDQALLHALYAEGRTVEDIAQERELAWSTVDSRHKRLLYLLYKAIHATMAALALLIPKRARAFVAHVTQQAPRMLVQATQFGGAMTMTVVCGVLMPTGSSFATEPSTSASLTPYSNPQTTMAQASPLQPSFVPKVEPEEPKGLDAETNECSAADMKSTKFASFVQKTVVPMALLVAPAFTQVACTGTQQQTPPARQADDEPDNGDHGYRVYCNQEHLRGNKCPTYEEYMKE
jgi:RNA polymerase sigma factor (sigma-70 family)